MPVARLPAELRLCEEAVAVWHGAFNASYLGFLGVVGDPDIYPWANWDFNGAYFFAYTLCTTIGYGTFAPVTRGGRLFACLYIVVGIPLNLALYADIADSVTDLLFGWPGGPLRTTYMQARPTGETSCRRMT